MRYSGKLQNPDRESQQREGPNKQAGVQTDKQKRKKPK